MTMPNIFAEEFTTVDVAKLDENFAYLESQVTQEALSATSSILSATGFVTLSNGLTVQWGTTASLGFGNSVITLPTPYSTAHFTAVITGLSGGGSVQIRDFVPTKTLTNFTINNQGATGTFNWISIGV